MADTFWHKQTLKQPLFPDLLWSRPEHKSSAGKLLIIGGNAHGFAAPAQAYGEATKAGIGTVRVLLPDALKKTVGGFLDHAEFSTSTPSGSFGQQALAEWLDHSLWADGVLLPGDLGRNSETAIIFEQFLAKYSGQLTLTKDALDYALGVSKPLLKRPNTLIVASFEQLQKLLMLSGWSDAITFKTDLIKLVEILRDFTARHPVIVITKHLEQVICACDGQVSTTKLEKDIPIWRVQTAARASVWWIQNPTKPFEALSSALVA